MPRWASLTLAGCCLLFAGCGPKVTYKYVIAVVPKGLTHQFWQSIERGADRAAADFGEQGIKVKILWEGPRKESDSSAQIDIVKQMVGREIHGLVLAPQHSAQMVPVVKEAADSGAAVVIIDSGLKDRDLMVKYVATNNYNGGKMAGNHLLKVLDKDGKKAPKVVLFRYQPGSESTEQREKGFIDAVKAWNKDRPAGSKAEIIEDRIYAGATVSSAQSAAADVMSKHKDTADGIFAVNESAATGMLNAMRSQKVNKKIRLMGFDSSEPLLQAVKEGDVVGLIVQDPYRMGYLGVWFVVQHLEGQKVATSDKDKDYSTGEYLVTKDNVDDENTRQLFDPELQAERTIIPPKVGKKK